MNKTLIILLVIFISTSIILGGIAVALYNYQSEESYDSEKYAKNIAESNSILNDEIASLKTEIKSLENKNATSVEFLGNCSLLECVFDHPNGLLGSATIKGYYSQRKVSPWDEIEICDVLVIEPNSTEFFNHYMNMVERGNSINYKDDQGNLLFSLDLSVLDENEQQKIRSATKDNPVELFVQTKMPRETSAPACHSFVNIISVK
jgi:hypothetical protein